jgi:hypothetical protein
LVGGGAVIVFALLLIIIMFVIFLYVYKFEYASYFNSLIMEIVRIF